MDLRELKLKTIEQGADIPEGYERKPRVLWRKQGRHLITFYDVPEGTPVEAFEEALHDRWGRTKPDQQKTRDEIGEFIHADFWGPAGFKRFSYASVSQG